MKRIVGALVLVLLAAIPGPAYGQIPNPGFESWTGVVGYDTPTGWLTSNIPTVVTNITKSADARSGSAAVRGEVVDIPGSGPYPPILLSFFSYAQRPGSLTGYYKFTSAGNDSLLLFVALYKGSLFTPVAYGVHTAAPNVTAFTKFSVPLEYFSGDTPDTAEVNVTIENSDSDSTHVGSVFLLDDLAFEGTATDVADQQGQPTAYALEQNYPNPFNPETAIRYDIPEASLVRLAVFNALGQEISVLVNEQEPAGSYQVKFNGQGLPSGVYFYRLEANPVTMGAAAGKSGAEESGGAGRSFVQTRRLVLVR